MTRYTGKPQLHREGQRVQCAGVSVSGTVLINEKYGDPVVIVRFDGVDKPAGIPASKLKVVDKPRAITARKPTVEKRAGCFVCGADHGEDGHPLDWDD